MPRIDALLREARPLLDHGEADLLLAHALDRGAAWLFAHADHEVDAGTASRFATLIDRRRAGEPVAYITGRRGFWSLDLEVGPSTLIPRPETERLVELALDRLPPGQPLDVLDLGTGSGAIALAIASERPRARVTAMDASADALRVAARNAAANRVTNVRLLEGDWFAPVAGQRFDLVASNPPYIAEGDPHLARGDLRFEPTTALASGPDGLADIRRISADAPAHLKPGGWLLVEHGLDQGAAVRNLFTAAGFVDVATERDLEDRDRVSLGRWPG